MKKNVFLFLFPLLFFVIADAQAQEWCGEEFSCYEENCTIDPMGNFYAKIFSGANFLQNSTESGNKARYDTGYIISGSLGYGWCNGLSVEGEYAYRRNAISNIDFITEGSSHNGYFHTSSYMANLLWDLPLYSWGFGCWNIRPFIGAGIGYDSQKMHASNSRVIFNQRWSHFSWQLMTGLAYSIFCNTELTVEYKFHQSSSHFVNHVIGVGLAYKFCF